MEVVRTSACEGERMYAYTPASRLASPDRCPPVCDACGRYGNV